MEEERENRKEMNIKNKKNRTREKSVDDYTIQVRGGFSLIKKCEEHFGCNLFTAILRHLGAQGSDSHFPPSP